MNRRRLFAIVPAAGESRRMGRHKLLLKIGEATVIRRLLDALSCEGIVDRIVVVRPGDALLADEAAQAGATVVQPSIDPPDMRASVEFGLDFVRANHAPADDDGWLLVPADHPVLDAPVVASLVDCWHRSPTGIVVPTHQGKRGHPTVFSWRLAREVQELPKGAGLNLLVQRHANDVREIEVRSATVLADLDTPEDFETLRKQFDSAPGE